MKSNPQKLGYQLSIFVLLAGIWVAWNVYELLPYLKLKTAGMEIEAVVIDKIKGSEGRRVVYQFEVSGNSITGKSPLLYTKWDAIKVGEIVSVQYSSQDPRQSVLKGWDLKTLGATWYLFLSLLLMALLWDVDRRFKRALPKREN